MCANHYFDGWSMGYKEVHVCVKLILVLSSNLVLIRRKSFVTKGVLFSIRLARLLICTNWEAECDYDYFINLLGPLGVLNNHDFPLSKSWDTEISSYYPSFVTIKLLVTIGMSIMIVLSLSRITINRIWRKIHQCHEF